MLSRRLLRIKVVQGLYSHLSKPGQTIENTYSEVLLSAQRCYELYILTFSFIVAVRDYAQGRIDIGLSKQLPSESEKNPNLRFVENPVVVLLGQSENLKKALAQQSWISADTLIKDVYNEMCASDYFKRYMDKKDVTFEDHRRMAIDFYLHHIEDNPLFEQEIEERSIFWVDNVEYALSFIVQTLGALTAQEADIKLPAPYKSQEDKEFVEQLARASMFGVEQNTAVINELIENWDLERVAFMDKVIMLVAIAELTTCDSIPVKATLDEYIEIAKYYSTPQSASFINGVLNKAVANLTISGRIKKSGRGLI
ncbi:MAG: transcription antitermination protein NusB [Mucinivorans sp.]